MRGVDNLSKRGRLTALVQCRESRFPQGRWLFLCVGVIGPSSFVYPRTGRGSGGGGPHARGDCRTLGRLRQRPGEIDVMVRLWSAERLGEGAVGSLRAAA